MYSKLKPTGCFFIYLIICFTCGRVAAQEYNLLTADIPPYSILNRDVNGFCLDLTQTIFKRANLDLNITFYPWARAQKTAIQGKDFIITPLTRTPEREALYDWIVPLISYKLQFVTNDKTIPINDLEQLKNHKVCALRESPANYALHNYKFTNPSLFVEESVCLKLLSKKRVNAVLVHGFLSAVYWYKEYGADPNELIKGLSFPSGTIYLGSSKDFLPSEIKALLNEKLEEVKKDGIYDKLLKLYQE